MTSFILAALLLAGTFIALNIILRRRGDERLYRRVTIIGAAIGLAIVFGIFAAIRLGFIPDHAP